MCIDVPFVSAVIFAIEGTDISCLVVDEVFLGYCPMSKL